MQLGSLHSTQTWRTVVALVQFCCFFDSCRNDDVKDHYYHDTGSNITTVQVFAISLNL